MIPVPPALRLAHRSFDFTLSMMYFVPSSQINSTGIITPCVTHFRVHPIRSRHCRQSQPYRVWSSDSSLYLTGIIGSIIIDPQLSIEKPYADLCFYYPYGLSGTLYSSSGELASSLSCHCTQAATT